jgi:hypothetical protein
MTMLKTPTLCCLMILVVSVATAQQKNHDSLFASARKGDKPALIQLRTLADKGDYEAPQ